MQIRQRTPAGLALIAVAATALFMGLVPAANAKVQVQLLGDGRLSVARDPVEPEQGGRPEDRRPACQERARPQSRHLGERRLLRAARRSRSSRCCPNWQIWAVERRENFLEDQSELNLLKQGKASPTDLFNYYLGYIGNPSITHHMTAIPDSAVPFAREWGMNTEINDLRVVVKAAERKGRNVAMGGHSLGGSITTAYATWDFNGRPGGRDLSGLVLIDGASNPTPVTPEQATMSLNNLQTSSPWLSFGGIPAPLAGLFGMVGSATTKAAPNSLSVFSGWPFLPANLQPPPGVNLTNEAGFGYTTDAATSPPNLRAAQVHSGHLAASGDPRGWVRDGAITPIQRWASMFSGWGLQNLDGTAWYHPLRLTIDSGAVGNGVANPAQSVLDVHSTDASKLPKRLRIYAFGAALGGPNVLGGRAGAGRHGRDPEPEPEAGQPAGDLCAQRPERRGAEGQRLLQAADPVPEQDQRGEGSEGEEEVGPSAALDRAPAAAPGADAAVGDVKDALEALALQDRGGQAAALAAAADRGDLPGRAAARPGDREARRRGGGPSRGCAPPRTRARRGRRGRSGPRRRAARRARSGSISSIRRTGRPSERQAVIPPAR